MAVEGPVIAPDGRGVIEHRDFFHGARVHGNDPMPPFDSDQRNLHIGGDSRPSWFPKTELPPNQSASAAAFEARRQAHADTIAWELSTRHEFDRVPALVQDFLFGPWSLVLAHVELAGSRGRADAQRYRAAVTDLLWSVKRDVSLRSPAEWLQRVPPLVATLREGLRVLDDYDDVHEPFFEGLMALHRPVLQLRRARSQRDARDSTTAEEDTRPAEPDGLAANHGEAPLAVTRDAEAAPQPEAGATPQTAEAACVDEPAALVARLEPGQAADLWCDARWLRAQLTWVSSEHSFFLFVSEGGRQHSMTRRSCERLIRAGQLKLVAPGEDRPASAG
jgi:hypothetical protein